jgi:hypothetical protein
MKTIASRNLKLRMLFSIVLIFFLNTLAAQTETDNPYPQLLFQGFHKGTILLKSGKTSEAFLNYSMVDEEMLLDTGGEYRVLNKPEDVDTVYIQDRKFVLVGKVFYEIVSKGKVSLFLQHKCRYVSAGTQTAYGMTSHTNDTPPVSSVQKGTQVRHLEMPDNVKVTPLDVYWVQIGTEYQRFSNFKQYAKLFGDQEDKVKEFVKTNDLDIKKIPDLKKLGEFSSSLVK